QKTPVQPRPPAPARLGPAPDRGALARRATRPTPPRGSARPSRRSAASAYPSQRVPSAPQGARLHTPRLRRSLLQAACLSVSPSRPSVCVLPAQTPDCRQNSQIAQLATKFTRIASLSIDYLMV